jgi:hypothetical protein
MRNRRLEGLRPDRRGFRLENTGENDHLRSKLPFSASAPYILSPILGKLSHSIRREDASDRFNTKFPSFHHAYHPIGE